MGKPLKLRKVVRATRANMRLVARMRGPIVASSRRTGETCSADYRDYFWLGEDECLIDSDGADMILSRVRSETLDPIYLSL